MFRGEAAALEVGPMCRVEQVRAATPPGVLARGGVLAAFEVRPPGLGEAVGAAPVLL